MNCPQKRHFVFFGSGMDFWGALAAHHVMPTQSCCTHRVMLWVHLKGASIGCSQQVPPAQCEGPIICLEHKVQNGKNSRIWIFFFFFPLALIKSIGKKKKKCLFASYFILIRLTIPVLSKCLFQHFQAKEFLSLFKMTFRNKFNFRVLSTSV